MSENKAVRQQLEKEYGKGCMFQKAKIEEQVDELNKTRKRQIRTYKQYKKDKRFTPKKIKLTERIISVHHLIHRSEGGKTTPENCTNINRLAHDYIHDLPRGDEEVINNMLREYKKEFTILSAQIQGNEIVKAKMIKVKEPEEYITIPLLDNKELYEEHKKQRNERVFKKFEEVER